MNQQKIFSYFLLQHNRFKSDVAFVDGIVKLPKKVEIAIELECFKDK